MLPMSTVAAILIAVLNISFVIASSETDKVEIYWVSTSLDRCKDKWPCNTLEGYKEEDITLNRSNVTWIFLKGQHVMPFPLNLEFVENVTLRGEDECFANQCTLILPKKCFSELHLISDVKMINIYIKTLKRMRINIYFAKGFWLENVTFSPNITLHFVNPLDIFHAKYCNFSQLTFEFKAKKTNEQPHIFVIISDCTFVPKQSIDVGLRVSIHEDIDRNITVITKNSYFYNQAFGFFGECYGLLHTISIVFDQCTFEYHIRTLSRQLSRIVQIILEPVQNTVISKVQIVVNMKNCQFQNVRPLEPQYIVDLRTVEGVSIIYVQVNNTREDQRLGINSEMLDGPIIQIQDTVFENTQAHHIFRGNILQNGLENTHDQSVTYNPIWEIVNCTFRYNHGMTHLHFSLMLLENFNQYPMQFSNGNSVTQNVPCELQLVNTKLLIKGYNEILDNNIGKVSEMNCIELDKSSKIVLFNNSVLNISRNLNRGITVLTQSISNFADFVRCYVKKVNCSGSCIFQLLSSNGRLLSRKELINIKATISLNGNIKPEIYNGHLLNCSLLTTEGYIYADVSLLKKVIHVVDWEDAISSPPYHICLCRHNQQIKINQWNCNEKSQAIQYPGQKLLLYVSIVGDLGHILKQKVNIAVKGSESSNVTFITGSCTKLEGFDTPNNEIDSYQVELSAEEKGIFQTYKIRHLVMVNVSACPPGFSLSKYGYNQTSKHCICMPHLSNYIKCTITNFGVHYQAHLPHYWIQIDKETVLYSDYCLTVYCNDILFEKGITLESSNQQSEVQCSNGRVGKLCGSCPKGYSTTFGSSACRKCQGPWYLLAIILGFVGLLLVVILFLLNLTVLQGTILGVSFYANITYLYSDYFEQYGGPFLYAILSWLNFGVGFELCFFDGMDEFTKAILQFVFPTYLFVILLVIIIGAHKYNWKIFRVPFIAKRAVPVLATMMLLTYSNIAGAVIIPLRFSTIYSTNGETTTVWLQQGDIPYFQGKHLVLVILSLAFTLFYLFPLTFILLFGDILRRYTRKLWFSHFLDVFYGAFKKGFGFWLGVRLLLRIIILILKIKTSMNAFTNIIFHILSICMAFELIAKPFIVHKRCDYCQKNKSPLVLRLRKGFHTQIHPNMMDPLLLFTAIVFTYAALQDGKMLLRNFNTKFSFLVYLSLVLLLLLFHGCKYFPLPTIISQKSRAFGSALQKRFFQKKIQEQPHVGINVALADALAEFPFYEVTHLQLLQESDQEEETFSSENTDYFTSSTASNY